MFAQCLKSIALSLIPAFVLGLVFYFLISLTQGMDGLQHTSPAWYWIGVLLFSMLLSMTNQGRFIFARTLMYGAYLFWAMPFFSIFYMFASAGQANEAVGAIGAAGAGIGGFITALVFSIVGGFGGLILYLIGKNLLKRQKRMTKHKKNKVVQVNG